MRNRPLLNLVLALFAFATGRLHAATENIPLANQRVLWLGDSITQAGDYVTFTEYYLEKANPQTKFDIVSIGLSGETVSGLSEKTHPFPRPCVHNRLPRALELVKPALVIACYGMNDGIYHPASRERLEAFQDGMRKLIDAGHAAGARVIVLTPPPFGQPPGRTVLPKDAPDFSYSAPYENYDEVLAEFARWEMTLPPKDALAIDLHTPMNNAQAKRRETNPGFSFAVDGVHPTPLGHLLMAQIVLHGLGVMLPDMPVDLDAEFARIQADPVYALIKQRREARSTAWLAYVGVPGAIERAETDCAKLQSQIDGLRAKTP